MTNRCNLLWVWVVLWTVSAFFVGGVPAGVQTGNLPTGWQDLPPEQFVAVARNVMESGAPDERDVLAIRQHAAQLLTTLGPTARVAYGDFAALYTWGAETLTATQRNAALVRRAQAKGDFAGWSCAQLIETSVRLSQQGVPYPAQLAIVVAWLGENDVRAVAQLDDLAWLCLALDGTDYHLPQAAHVTVEQLSVVRAHVAQQITALASQLDALPYVQQLLLYRWGQRAADARAAGRGAGGAGRREFVGETVRELGRMATGTDVPRYDGCGPAASHP